MKKILLLNGNPKPGSFSHQLCDSYQIEAREQADIRRLNLATMDFNANLQQGYDTDQALEPCLTDFQQALSWADHLVIVTPIWWGGLPAKLKGLVDRALLPGFAFKFEQGSVEPTPLLTGKTSRIILSMDAPADYAAEQARPVLDQLDRFTLQYCGFAPATINLFGSVIMADAQRRQQWQQDVGLFGAEDC